MRSARRPNRRRHRPMPRRSRKLPIRPRLRPRDKERLLFLLRNKMLLLLVAKLRWLQFSQTLNRMAASSEQLSTMTASELAPHSLLILVLHHNEYSTSVKRHKFLFPQESSQLIYLAPPAIFIVCNSNLVYDVVASVHIKNAVPNITDSFMCSGYFTLFFSLRRSAAISSFK